MFSKKHYLFTAVLAACLCLPAAAQGWKSVDDPALPRVERMRLSDYEVSIYRDGVWKKLEVTGENVIYYGPGEVAETWLLKA